MSSTLDRVLDPDDAWSARMTAGTSYRINLVGEGDVCPTAAVFAPGTSFDDAPVADIGCGYVLYTPRAGATGRHSIRVSARESRGLQRYRLVVAPAGRDDVAPGVFIRNHERVRVALNGRGIDVVDLYRFDVESRSELTLRLAGQTNGDVDIRLLDDRGRELACGCGGEDDEEIRRVTRRGRYFVAVRSLEGAAGRYQLTRISRTVTRTRVSFAGRGRAQMRPGVVVPIGVRVTSGADGPVTITVERFDPLEGWLFHRRFGTRAVNGRAVVGFLPPGVGRFRATAAFEGTRVASPSASGTARLLVAGPLRS